MEWLPFYESFARPRARAVDDATAELRDMDAPPTTGPYAGTSACYTRYRPAYPTRLIEDLVRRAGADGRARLLDDPGRASIRGPGHPPTALAASLRAHAPRARADPRTAWPDANNLHAGRKREVADAGGGHPSVIA